MWVSCLSLFPSICISWSPFLPIWASCHLKCACSRTDCQLSLADRQLGQGCPPPAEQTCSWVGHHPWVDLYALVWPGKVCKASQNKANPLQAPRVLLFPSGLGRALTHHTTRISVRYTFTKPKKRRFAKLNSCVCRRGRSSSKGLHWREKENATGRELHLLDSR